MKLKPGGELRELEFEVMFKLAELVEGAATAEEAGVPVTDAPDVVSAEEVGRDEVDPLKLSPGELGKAELIVVFRMGEMDGENGALPEDAVELVDTLAGDAAAVVDDPDEACTGDTSPDEV